MQVNKSDLLKRLKKIEGQVRGVQKMIEEDRYCMDILVQLAAIKSATNNIGLAILECPEASEKIEAGDEVAVDFDTGVITNVTKNETYQANPFPAFIKEIIQAGGLMASIKERQGG